MKARWFLTSLPATFCAFMTKRLYAPRSRCFRSSSGGRTRGRPRARFCTRCRRPSIAESGRLQAGQAAQILHHNAGTNQPRRTEQGGKDLKR